MYRSIIILFLFAVTLGCDKGKINAKIIEEKFLLGNEVLIGKNIDKLRNKKIALVTNQTGITANGTHITDTLVSLGINVVKIFTPEHGIRGDENYSNIDEKTGIPVISIYGDKSKPTPADLSDVEIVIYDIQDVGARFYTYTSTLYYLVEAVTENNVELIVCDRPLIINPSYVDGFMLEDRYESFVGKIPTPVCYGLTCGELASMLSGGNTGVTVIKMESYARSTDYNSLNLKWVKPSPSIFTSMSALCYPAECFLEGTNVSEGRGTGNPFEYCGAPWIDGKLLAAELKNLELEGVSFEETSFIPNEKISAYPPKFFNQQCYGVKLIVTDKRLFEPVKTGVAVIWALNKLFDKFEFTGKNFIDKLAGTDKLRIMINSGNHYLAIIESWQKDLNDFIEKRSAYLLYK